MICLWLLCQAVALLVLNLCEATLWNQELKVPQEWTLRRTTCTQFPGSVSSILSRWSTTQSLCCLSHANVTTSWPCIITLSRITALSIFQTCGMLSLCCKIWRPALNLIVMSWAYGPCSTEKMLLQGVGVLTQAVCIMQCGAQWSHSLRNATLHQRLSIGPITFLTLKSFLMI